MKRRRRIWIVLLLVAALTLGLAWSFRLFDGQPFLTAADVADWDGNGIELRFFDVGQADSILVRCGNDSMLVDGGNRDDGPRLLAALESLGVDCFACVVCTHPHEDHAGGLSYVAARIPMQRALAPCREADSYWFGDFAVKAGESCGLTVPKPGDEFALGGATVQVLGPLRWYEDMNDNSIILRVVYGDTAFLLTGDATYVAEGELADSGADLKADLLKAGHHGANSSSSYHFLELVAPDYAVISVGADNEHGHPGEYTLDRMSDAGIRVLRTDQLGTIVCRSDGRRLSFGTPERDGAEK